MKRSTLKLLIGFLTFILGVTTTAIYLFNSFPSDSLKTVQVIQMKTDLDEQYVVYSVLINEMFIKENSSITPLNISSQTSSPEKGMNALFYPKEVSFQKRMDFLKHQYSSVAEDTLVDFENKRLESVKIFPRFNVSTQYNLITEKEIEKNGGRVATQLISFSQIGFNQNRTQAFVIVDYFCPVLCGFGKCVLLEKQNGVWQIKEEFRGWVS